MKLQFSTHIDGHFLKVFEHFEKPLFEKLQPPLLPSSIDRYDGNFKGAEVHLSLGPKFLSQKWVSLITDVQQDDTRAFFIDEGATLPFPLIFWKHKHIVSYKSETESIIIDSLEFKAKNKALELLITPAISAMFILRKPIYKSFFKNLSNDT